jgi:hypothetical protein
LLLWRWHTLHIQGQCTTAAAAGTCCTCDAATAADFRPQVSNSMLLNTSTVARLGICSNAISQWVQQCTHT